MSDVYLSVVVPARGEEDVRETERRIRAYLDFAGRTGEVLFVRDEAERDVMRRARGRYILKTEPGLPTPMKEVEKLIRAVEEGADAAVGLRPGILGRFLPVPCDFKLFKREAVQTARAEGLRTARVPVMWMRKRKKERV